MSIIRSFNLCPRIVRLCLLAMLSLASGGASAQEVSAADSTAWKSATYQLGYGWVNILDTYVSAYEYKGGGIRFTSTVQRHRSNHSDIFQHDADVAMLKNKVGTGNEIFGKYRFRYGRIYDIRLHKNLTLRLGGQAAAHLGGLYNSRNTNNIGQFYLGLNIGPMLQLDFKFRIGGYPMGLRYEASSPFLGVMFSPNYGQSYYELGSKGNYDRNVVFTTIASTPSLRNTVSLDFSLDKRQKRFISIGYLGDYDQFNVNNLKYHNYFHGIMIEYRHF